ncbi:hypothetical protein PC128_g13885 [Phytophthora cactorum]|nr:hypothetical protein PC128_g13885 [Phytophthora cactorum]
MRAKETLQLRHQLSASGLSLRAATYDTRRHHVLTFDSHPLRPHVLRLFSLRRELKSVPLFDEAKRGKSSNSSPTGATQGSKRPSFFELQLQQQEQQKRLGQSDVEVVVPSVLLQYSPTLDVFVCVYNTATRPKGGTKVPKTTTHYVVLLEPATLRRLLVYQGPETHTLQCALFDPLTDRLVLASHLKSCDQDGGMLPKAPNNVVEILQLSKRLHVEDHQTSWSAEFDEEQPQPSMLLLIENTRASLRHPDTLTSICGSRGLRELYGAASDYSDSTDTSSVMLVWRQNWPNGCRLVLVRRVMIQYWITAMAVSPCGDWLLAGIYKGGLRVWNVNGSRTNGSELFTIDADPYEPTGSSVADAQAEVISSIEITTTSAPERDTGAVRHWKLSVEGKTFGDASYSEEHRYPSLSLVGYFNAGGKKQIGKEENSSRMFKNQDTLGPPLKTLTMCVTIDMGSCFENLLLVVREDVIHVLKVQSVLYVMQEFAPIEEVYAVRAFDQQNSSQIISLSSTAACKLRIFPLDEASSETKSSFVTPHPSEKPGHVCSMETMTNDRSQKCYVVLAWSSGLVDVYDVLRDKHVLKLQDKQLTDQISTLSVVTFQRVIKHKHVSAIDEAGEAGFLSSWSYGDISQSQANNLANYAASDTSEETAPRKAVIVVGTESGKLFGWHVELWDGDFTLRSIEKANVRAQAAHSSHIIQLARIDAVVRGARTLLTSVGTGGIIKIWSVPALNLIGYVNSVAEGYPVSPSCIELMRDQENNVGTGGRKASGKLYVSVGYDDGRLAVWRVEVKLVSFQRMEVSAKHERRVSKICGISKEVPTELPEFLSCSLDMTVIHWQISESGGVHEKRYFDIGAAIVDMVLVKEQAIIALAHEVCKFMFAPSSKSDTKYLLNPGEVNSHADKHTSEELAYECLPPAEDDNPDTPTTRSVEDPTDATMPSHKTVDEYLTLHVPSAVLHLEADSSSVVAGESAPATGDQSEAFFNLRDETADQLSRHRRGSKSTNKLHRALIDDGVLREYLQDYIARHGNGGTMTASRITHLLALRPELPSIRRPGFALAKSLKDLKLTAQTRVDPEEALQILRIMFTMTKTSYQSFDAPTMAGTLKRKENTNERARAQRLREKKRVRQKPVVTYNLLGEKYVHWEKEPADQEELGQNQSPSSSARSLIVLTPPSPNKDDMSAIDGDPPPDGIGFFEPTSKDTPSSTTNADGVVADSASHQDSLRALTDDLTHSHVLPSERNKPDAESPVEITQERSFEETEADDEEESEGESEGEEGDEDEENNDNDDDGDSDGDDGGTKEQNPVNKVPAAPSAATQAIPTAKKSHRAKHARKCIDSGVDNSRNALVTSIRLSPMFQQFWRKGYCWCSPAPQLHVIWTDNDKAKLGEAKATKRRLTCKDCHKRLHTVDLPRVGYVPHFSRQATFEIIVQVYSKLTATAHTSLYKNSSARKERSSECSVFSALFKMFLTTYGVHSTAEMKLKLFFVSMCHFLPEYDAVAVFGELLGLHMPEVAEECDQAPATLVALCVCCYSWLYSRGMVVNGDNFSGREWGKGYTSAKTEVVPTTDGTTHWQFVQVEHALLCAQDNLLYPLVSPEFLRNIMLFMQEYAQRLPTRSLRADSPDFSNDIGQNGDRAALWIELHRYLRLLVGEWKHQNAQFRAVERILFVHPQRDMAIEENLVEKLRLLLSCFVFYDHERVGVMAVSDFESLLFKLRYLWTEENAAMDDDAFDNAISATKKRFLDLNHDGQLCYLDFWVMLYIVGVKTRALISLHKIPSFCRDYRLEVSPELSDIVWNYMLLSCTLVLPKGLRIGKSSMDQKAERQHRRRVGGLHDGTFHFSKTLTGSLSTQELLRNDDTKKLGLFLDGSVPATRLTASTTALDRFRPISVENDGHSSRRRGHEPVVFGVRLAGPTQKPIAPLRVSLMGNYDSLVDTGSRVRYENYSGVEQVNSRHLKGEFKSGYTNTYIQFPEVHPVRRRVGVNEMTSRQIVGAIPVEEASSEEGSVIYEDSVIEQEEQVQEEDPPPVKVLFNHKLSTASVVPVLEMVQEEVVDQPESLVQSPTLEKRRSATPVVVVPTVEPEARVSSRRELLKRKSSRRLVRAASAPVKLEEVAVQLEAEKVEIELPPPRQPTPVVTAREESPPEAEVSESQGVVSSENGTDGADIEQTSVHDEELPREEPNDVVPVVVEEVPPQPEPVVIQAPVEPLEPVVIPEIVVIESVESPAVVEDPPEQIVVADIAEVEVVEEEEVSSIPDPAPIEEPIPTEEPVPALNTESEDASEEELPQSIGDTHYTPQVVKQDDTQTLHGFRFSQQPVFIRSVAATNPYRTAMWNPNDGSESDGDDDDVVESTEQQASKLADSEGFDEHDESNNHSPGDLQDKDDEDAAVLADTPLIPFRRKRLDEDAERALYGERIVNVLGEGIAFSPETEAAMKKKWQEFFDDSESKMFTTMRNDLEKKQTEQREAEERQIKLRKKWQEQRDQDLMRLQHSRQSSTVLTSMKQDSTDGAGDAGFRLRRIHRESCRQLTEELQFGVSVQRELKEARESQFFHFYYLPEGHDSIITLKMHVLRGDAEVFMSTDTKVPCSTDFMWRSSERLAKDSGEGHRIILYPHDLLKATSNAASKEKAPTMGETASLRSFYPKQADATSLRVEFYLSVVALEPGTAFTLAVMSSGQKMQPSRAIQTVDYLIDRFNMLSRSFQEHSTVSYASIMPEEVVRNGVDNEDDALDEDDDEDNTDDESTQTSGGRRKTKRITANGTDPQELKSFQRLLETLSEKKGFGSPQAASFLLAGPSEEHLEFVQDEDQRLQEMHRRLSPPKSCLEGIHGHHDAVSVVTERRLTLQGKRQKLRRVVAARLQQKLAPLRHKSSAGGELEKSASTGLLMDIRRPRPHLFLKPDAARLPRKNPLVEPTKE